MRIVEIVDRDGVARLQEAWGALQERCPDSSPFQTWEWNQAWWRHYRARKRLRILLFHNDQNLLVGIAPLYVSRHLGTPLRRLAWLGTGSSDYLEPLALPEYSDAVAVAFLAYLDCEMRGWDIADLQQLRAGSPLMGHSIRPWPLRVVAEQQVAVMEPCPYLPLEATWEAVTGRLGKKMRSNLAYYERHLQKRFPDAKYALADASTLEAGMTALFALHQSRWNARWLPGVLGSKRVQAFHREVAAQFLERGWLRLHLLAIDGALRAVLYCFAKGGRTFYYLGGFAPEFAKFSPGTLLTAEAIRQAIREGCMEFDFLRGNEPYKYRWVPEERLNHRLLRCRSYAGWGTLGMLPGRAGIALNHLERFIEHSAKEFAERQGRKEGAAPRSERSANPVSDDAETASDRTMVSKPPSKRTISP